MIKGLVIKVEDFGTLVGDMVGNTIGLIAQTIIGI